MFLLLLAACGKDEKNLEPATPRSWDQYFAAQPDFQIWREIMALDSAVLPPFSRDWLLLAPNDSLLLQRQTELGIDNWSEWPAQMGAELFGRWLASHFLSASPQTYRPSAARNSAGFALQRHWRETVAGPWADGQKLRAQGGNPALYALPELASLPTLQTALLVGPQPPSLFAQALARCSGSLRARLNQKEPYSLLVPSDSAIQQFWQNQGLRDWDHFLDSLGTAALNALVGQHILPGYHDFPNLPQWEGTSLTTSNTLRIGPDAQGILWLESQSQDSLIIQPQAVHCLNGCFYPLEGLLNFP